MNYQRNASWAVILVAIGVLGCTSDKSDGSGSGVGGQGVAGTGGGKSGLGGASAQGGGTGGSGTAGADGGRAATSGGAATGQGGRSVGGASVGAGGAATGSAAGKGGATAVGLGGTGTGGTGAAGGITSDAGGRPTSEGGGPSPNTGGASLSAGGTEAVGGDAGDAGGSPSSEGGGSSTNTGGTSGGTGGVEAAGGTTAAFCTSFDTPSKVGTIQSSPLYTTVEVKQLSGMVASRDNPNTLYGQCDSGANKIFVFDETGASLGSLTLAGVNPVDWEDLAIGVSSGTDTIYVADIGDNSASRASVVVHRFPEPAPGSLLATEELSISELESATFVYPDKAHNAEAFMVDPKTEDLVIVTKENTGVALVFRASVVAFGEDGATTLEKIGEISTGAASTMSSQVGAGDISPSGDAVILRSYGSILLFPRLATWAETFAATPITVPSPTEQQSEGLTFNSDGTAWFSAGETDDSLYEGVSTCH